MARIASGAIPVLLGALGALLPAAVVSQDSPRRVLVLQQEQQYLPAAQLLESALLETLAHDSRRPLVYVEHLDLTRLSDPAQRRNQFGWLESKYGGATFDVVVAIGPEVMRAMSMERPGFIGTSPIVSWSIDTPAAAPSSQQGGVISASEPARTLALIRTLLPDTTRVIVVSGDSALDDALVAPLIRLADTGVPLDFVRGEPLDLLSRRVATLGRGTVVLFTSMIRDRDGRSYAAAAVASALVESSAVPVFVTMETTFVDGVVGGELLDYRAAGRELGAQVQRALAGGPGVAPKRIPARRVVDGRILQRLGVPSARVPPGYEVTNADNWSAEVRRTLGIGVVIVLAQALTIGALLMARRRRVRAEKELAERARFYSIMADASASLTRLADADVATGVPDWLRRVAEACGAERVTLYRLDAPRRLLEVREAYPSGDGPFPGTSLQGQEFADLTEGRTVERCSAADRVDAHSSPPVGAGARDVLLPASVGGPVADVLGVTWPPGPQRDVPAERLRTIVEVLANALARARNAADLSERLAELESSRAEQRRLAGHLIDAQESERRRVARELHDDIAQRLSVIGMQLWASAGEPGPSADLGRIAESVSELASDVSRLSHRLHPDLLHRIGLAAALRGLCRDASEPGRLVVESYAETGPAEPSGDAALTAYRVAQEALRNVRKHSGARHASLRLNVTEQELQLEVRDEGRGFDPAITARDGLGLTSMRERAEMLGGGLAVESRPGQGTRIRLRLPMAARVALRHGDGHRQRDVQPT